MAAPHTDRQTDLLCQRDKVGGVMATTHSPGVDQLLLHCLTGRNQSDRRSCCGRNRDANSLIMVEIAHLPKGEQLSIKGSSTQQFINSSVMETKFYPSPMIGNAY